MEARFGAILILLMNKANVPMVNELLSSHSEIILGRQRLSPP